MLGAMDLLLLPSIHEGLPLVLLEAQAAGLTTVASENVPQEGVIQPALVRYLPLAAGPRAWAETVLQVAREPRFDRRRALAAFQSSPFEIGHAVRKLCGIYLERPAGRHPLRNALPAPGRSRG